MRKRILTAAVAAATLASGAQAAGFYLKEQSVVGQGRAFAGSAAGTDGASAAYFNPAGLIGVENQIELGVHFISPEVTVKNNGTTSLLAGSNDSVKPYKMKPVPNGHFVNKIDENTAFGVSVGAPYGFNNDYKTDSFTREDHRKVEFSTIETTFSLAKAISEKTNLAVGLVHQYIELDQDKANGALTEVKLKGDSVDYGYLIAIQHQTSDETTIGASYRSQVTHTIDGTLGSTPVTAPFQLPDIFALGADHKLTDKTRIYSDITWYGWSAYSKQPITPKAGGAPLSTVESNYSNTVSFGLGLEHDYSNGLTARAGIMIDPTPTNDTDRTSASPDSDRTWLALGLSKEVSSNMTIDAALTHIMADNTEVNKQVTTGFVRAKVEGYTNILSLGFRYKF